MQKYWINTLKEGVKKEGHHLSDVPYLYFC